MASPIDMPNRRPAPRDEYPGSKIEVAPMRDFFGNVIEGIKIRDRSKGGTQINVSDRAFAEFILLVKEGAYDDLVDLDDFI